MLSVRPKHTYCSNGLLEEELNVTAALLVVVSSRLKLLYNGHQCEEVELSYLVPLECGQPPQCRDGHAEEWDV